MVKGMKGPPQTKASARSARDSSPMRNCPLSSTSSMLKRLTPGAVLGKGRSVLRVDRGGRMLPWWGWGKEYSGGPSSAHKGDRCLDRARGTS